MELRAGLVLVAGAGGWLGRGLLEALLRGLPDVEALREPYGGRIRILLLPGEEAPSDPRVEVVRGDVRVPEDCRRFADGARDGILISAVGIIHPRRVRDFYAVNVDGTVNLLRAATAAGVRRGVFVSSNSPLGCNPFPDHRFDEESPYAPYMHYGRSKMLMEKSVRAAHAEGGLEAVIVRPPWFYGPWQPPRQTLFFRMIREGKAPIVGGGGNRRSMVYIDNLSQGLLRAAEAPAAAGRTYWIADARPYAMTEIVDTVERLLETEFGRSCARKRLRLPGLASTVARGIDRVAQGAGLYLQKIHVLSEMNQTIACSIERARRDLGYEPWVALDEGMRRSLRWLEARGMLP